MGNERQEMGDGIHYTADGRLETGGGKREMWEGVTRGEKIFQQIFWVSESPYTCKTVTEVHSWPQLTENLAGEKR